MSWDDMPRLRGGGAFGGMRMNETLNAMFGLTLEHDPDVGDGGNAARLAALRAAINETFSDNDVFERYFDCVWGRLRGDEFVDVDDGVLSVARGVRDVALGRRTGLHVGWEPMNFMLEGVDKSAQERLATLWGIQIWTRMASYPHNFLFRLPQVLMRGGWDRAYAPGGVKDDRGVSLWSGGKFGSSDGFSSIEIYRRWRIPHGSKDKSGGLAGRALARELPRALLSEACKLAILGDGEWPGLLAIARDEDNRAAAIMDSAYCMRRHIDAALERDGWGGFETDDVFVICHWRMTRHWRTRAGVPAFSPREFVDFGLDEREAIVVVPRRFVFGLDQLPLPAIRGEPDFRDPEHWRAGGGAKIGFCQLTGAGHMSSHEKATLI